MSEIDISCNMVYYNNNDICGNLILPPIRSKMNVVKQMMQWADGSLGNLLQCQSLDVPQTMQSYGCVRGGIYSCNEYNACLCKRCSKHWEKYIKLTLQCPHKGTGTLATCEHFPILPRSTPRDYPPPRPHPDPLDPRAKVHVIETKARQAVTKQELTNRTSKELHVKDPKDRDAQVKDTKTKSDKEPAAGYVHNFENETVCKTSTIHTVPLPPDPLESANKTKVTSADDDQTNVTKSPKVKMSPISKRRLRESLQIHRRSHEIHEGRTRKKVGREISKDRRIIKKRLKDSDNYVLERGKIITRKGSFSNSFSALPSGPLFEGIMEMPVSKDDDIFEKIASEERRAEFFGSSDDLMNLGKKADSDTATLSQQRKGANLLNESLSLQLKTHLPSWEVKEEAKMVAIGNNNLHYNSSASADSFRVKTSNQSLCSKESLSLKKHRTTSSKGGSSNNLSKNKDHRKRRAKRSKFTTTSESGEFMAGNSTDIENENLSIVSSVMMDGRKKKRSRGKKTPLEFEKRLIAGTKRYYMTKLEKLRSNSREKLGITERSSPEFNLSEELACRSPSDRHSRDELSPASLVSLPPRTCSSPQQDHHQKMRSESRSSTQGSSKHNSPLFEKNESKIPSPIFEQCKRGSGVSTSVTTPCSNNTEPSAISRPNSTSCVISVSRLRNVRVGPSIKERFCNSLVFAEKVNKPERSRFVNLTEGESSASINDGFSAQLKASKIKLHRELALEEHLTPRLTPAWTFSYISPAAPSYSEYINNVDIHI